MSTYSAIGAYGFDTDDLAGYRRGQALALRRFETVGAPIVTLSVTGLIERSTTYLSARLEAAPHVGSLVSDGQASGSVQVQDVYLAAHQVGPPWSWWTSGALLPLLRGLYRDGRRLNPQQEHVASLVELLVDARLICRVRRGLGPVYSLGARQRDGEGIKPGDVLGCPLDHERPVQDWTQRRLTVADLLDDDDEEGPTPSADAALRGALRRAQAARQAASPSHIVVGPPAAPEAALTPEQERLEQARRRPGVAWADKAREWHAPVYGDWFTTSKEKG